MDSATFEYTSYISSSPEKVWDALVEPRLTAQYWQHANVSDWKPGSLWEHRRDDAKGELDLVGHVVEFDKPSRLVLTWASPGDESNSGTSKVTIRLEAFRGLTMLSLRHEDLVPGSEMLEGIVDGWPKVLSSLKTFLESGKALPKLW